MLWPIYSTSREKKTSEVNQSSKVKICYHHEGLALYMCGNTGFSKYFEFGNGTTNIQNKSTLPIPPSVCE